MKVLLHGTETETSATTVGAFVDERVADRRGVAVAVDGQVVPRADWDATELRDGATVELVGAVQGG